MGEVYVPVETEEVSDKDKSSWNNDPEWIAYITSLEPLIQAISVKYCSSDEALREDCQQEARMALLTVFPQRIRGYEDFVAGRIEPAVWEAAVERYCRNVIRNSILSYLDAYPTGNWYIGRTRTVKDRRTGKTRKVHQPARFSSLDELIDSYGMQIDEHGNVSWPEPSTDGIDVVFQQGNVWEEEYDGYDS